MLSLGWLKRNLKGDPAIWTVIISLTLLSILCVYSAVSGKAYLIKAGDTEYFLFKHIVLLFLGLLATWVAHNINYIYYARLSRLLLLLSVPLLIYTFLWGAKINGAARWINIPLINQSFQPSDLAKLALIANLASMLAKRQEDIEDVKKTLYPLLGWCSVICGLIALSDLSTALLLFMTCVVIMLIGRVPFKQIATLIVVVSTALVIGLAAGDRLDTAISRMANWWGIVTEQIPFNDLSYQAQQALLSVFKGGFWGTGLAGSQQRHFLPAADSDYIFAVLIEEHGLKIGIVVLLAYLVLLYRGMVIASRSDRAFGGLLSVGLSFGLVIQAMINMGVVVGLFPVTGQPLPLLSMGGTSLLFTGLSLGIILSVSRGDLSEEVSEGNQLR